MTDTWQGLTRTHSLAATSSAKRTLAMPSASLSKRTTFVTAPSFEHSSRMSSLMSSIAAASSYNEVSICRGGGGSEA